MKSKKFIIFIILIMIASGCAKKEKEVSEYETFIGYLEEMAKDFYENSHYPKLGGDEETKKEYLEKYSTVGITIDLENLGRYDSDKQKDTVLKFVNSTTGEECDNKKTKVVIYPKKPYGVQDYTVDTFLVCGFDEEES